MDYLRTFKYLKNLVFDSKRYDKASLYKPEFGTLYDQRVHDLDGGVFDLSGLRGQVVLICNVASECGYTKCGYRFLVEEYTKYHDKGFTVLGAPCNQFGRQEPGTPAEIREFAKSGFNADFPLLEKLDVNGADTHPLYVWLKKSFPGDVAWNFNSFFVIDRQGIPVRRFTKDPYPEIDAFLKQIVEEKPA